jgi:putative resolvase
MSRFVKIGEAASLLGVSIQTMRRWELLGEIIPDRKTVGKTRYYDLDKLLGLKNIESDVTIVYARQAMIRKKIG